MEFEEFENSTDVKGITYDEESFALCVFFQRGVTYRYEDVPPDIVQGFREANSKGRYVGKYLKNKYRAERVDLDESKSEEKDGA